MYHIKIISLLLSIFLLVACDLRETASRKENLPKARGHFGDVWVVMDSAQWKGSVGTTLRGIFNELVPGIPRNQPMFDLQYVDPLNFQSMFKMQRNLIIVTVLNDRGRGNRKLRTFFTKESIERIEADSALFMFTKEDDFARGQKILHLFGSSEEDLTRNMRANEDKLLDYFLQIEKQRLYDALYNTPPEKGIIQHLQRKFDCTMKVPYGYEIALESEDFIWLRTYGRDMDKNLVISHVPYRHKEQFSKDSMISLRNRVIRPHVLYKPEDPEGYMTTETYHMDVHWEEVNFRGAYAVRMRGLWKTNKYTMGGPFIGYGLVDEIDGRFYYIEGFLYSPGMDQRDLIRELDVILSTFNTSVQQDA